MQFLFKPELGSSVYAARCREEWFDQSATWAIRNGNWHAIRMNLRMSKIPQAGVDCRPCGETYNPSF